MVVRVSHQVLRELQLLVAVVVVVLLSQPTPKVLVVLAVEGMLVQVVATTTVLRVQQILVVAVAVAIIKRLMRLVERAVRAS
jgi:hypothetical protein